MTDFIFNNLRWLIVSVVVLGLLVGGAIWGLNRWQDQPEYWLASAQKHYKEGETALERKDIAAAKASFEKAEQLLKKVLDASTGPAGEIWLFRYRVNDKLALTDPADAKLHRQNADKYLAIAGSDRSCLEGQQLRLMYLFREDNIQDLVAGKPYALNILTAKPEAHPNLKDLYLYQIGAHFILAWAEFYGQPANPDQALQHLEECRKLEQKYGQGTARDIRWREAGLEALARKAKAERDGRGGGEAAHAQLRKLRDQDIPAKLARVKETEPTKLSSTNLRGLLNFLLVAVELSTTPEQVVERAEMTVQVCEKLVSGDKPSGRNCRETARAMNLLTPLLIREPVPGRLPPEQWLRLSEQMVALVSRARAFGASVNLAFFLELVKQADRYQRHDKAEQFARLGLEAAATGQRVTNLDLVPELRTEAAWSLLVQNKLIEAQQQLSYIPRQGKQSERVHLLAGLVASLDGRLTDAVRELRLASGNRTIGRTLLPYSGLANAYLGLGRYDLALEKLQEHHDRYRSSFPLTPAEEQIANAFGLDSATVDLEMLRCCLALGKAEAAAKLRESLRGTPQQPLAELLAINSAIASGKALLELQDFAPARVILHRAGKELQLARKGRPNDPQLAWTEAQLLLAQHATSAKAEVFLRQFVSSPAVDPLSARIVWIAWLQHQGRTQDALNLLADVEKTYAGSPSVLHALRFVRAQLVLALAKSGTENTKELLNVLHGQRNDIGTSIVEVLRLTGSSPAFRSRQQGQAQMFYLSGQLAQSEKDFRQAIQFYERSLPFAAYRVRSEAGLLTSLLELSAAESPEQANRLAYELLQHNNANEPSILLAFAETAIPLNRIYGRLDLKGTYDEQERRAMQGALQRLEDALKKQGGKSVLGCYFKARSWKACGREDIAYAEIARALKLDPAHLPSLLLAGELAQTAGQGEDLLRFATALQQLPGKVEAKWEVRYWHALALHMLGRSGEARRAYQELIVRYPDRHEGYLGMARLLEQQKKIGEALQVMARWRERRPDDARGLEEMVRLLALDGKADQAEQLAQSLLQSQPSSPRPANGGKIVTARHVMEESNGSAQSDAQAGNSVVSGSDRLTPSVESTNDLQLRNLNLVIAVARGFGSAGVLDRAENWAMRAVSLADSLSSPHHRFSRLQDCQLLLGSLYVQRIEQLADGPDRNQYVDKAIGIYDAIRKNNPRQQQAAYRLATLLSKERQQHAAACAILEDALKSPTGEKAYLVSGDRLPLDYLILVGETCMSGHCSQSAVALLEQAVRHRYRDEPELFLFLGSCLAKAGKHAEAAKKLRTAALLADQRASRVPEDERQRCQSIKAEANRLLDQVPKAVSGWK